ncbi:hypothetical protein FZEAL_3829 [Fusarium zealandicum]|uniref:Uncharacterized protein n=1 Tax=Fusarium zealandicum TaxID=1053134 RepID=A0A8H4UNT9_9HYPO|nr:hypothetical protein FZEAL_3829 [Fusarium zealandicum]
MLTPQLFVRQVGDLSRDRRQLDLPMERPKRRAPAHLFERPAPPRPPPTQQQPPPPQPQPGRRPIQGGLPARPAPPTAAMSNMSLNSQQQGSNGASRPSSHHSVGQHHEESGGKIHKEKKRRNFLGIKK